jgi:DNA/RNA non-specific endonuclease
MPKRAPHRVSKETHLKVIVILLLAVVLLLWLVHCAGPKSVREQRLPARSEKAAERAEMSGKADRSDRFDRQDQPNQPGHRVYGTQLELPLYTDSTFIVRHPEARYTLCYDTSYRQAAWVAYLLTRSEVGRKDAERANAFRCDPEVVRRGWPTARDRDYARSGYDRGHLLPSADRDDTPSENRATFYLSNVSPQCAGLNRQIWRLLEEQVRRWAAAYDSLYVVTGPELVPGLPRIKGGVGVPRRYFKALLVWHGGRYHAIAFLIPNRERVEGGFGDYALSVNDLERQLGYDLFWRLPDSIEERVEGELDRTFWK